MKFSFAIATKDKEDDLKTGHKRSKAGDIIAYKPAGWEWGKEEVKRFLITEMEVKDEAEAERLCQPAYDGMTEDEVKNYRMIRRKEFDDTFKKYAVPFMVLDSKEKEDLISFTKINPINFKNNSLVIRVADQEKLQNDLVEVDKQYPEIKPIAKRKYKIDLAELNIDMQKLQDEKVEYQPLKEITNLTVDKYGIK